MEFSVECSACDEIPYPEKLIGLDWSVTEACTWGYQGSIQGVPRGMNNRTKVNFVVEEAVLVSSDISVIVDHPTSASSSSESRQVFLRDGGSR